MFFEDPAGGIQFEGSPFLILGRKVYDCQHGVDRHAKDKSRNKQQSVRDNVITNKQTKKEKGSKKERKEKKKKKILPFPSVCLQKKKRLTKGENFKLESSFIAHCWIGGVPNF